ncbi:tRNA (uracil(54)-C(5))-methyltransferase [Zancudomyces culisetae]|uniref:tRNA (Uracil(54)-C(5))-methyltransferase n=1 Tax=Zancudomyces culisetae TaxID=1213189 RepID=A0A1R1PPR1_ZANCU|nr:tRNA (uracil(54)-C(5))-methyltransferase [Zancudomyces culisetae]|eukprot:OMH82954.1 tRNA (uracil(54)-C(5))-methyltransferase [Zancudomyces culisetae]
METKAQESVSVSEPVSLSGQAESGILRKGGKKGKDRKFVIKKKFANENILNEIAKLNKARGVLQMQDEWFRTPPFLIPFKSRKRKEQDTQDNGEEQQVEKEAEEEEAKPVVKVRILKVMSCNGFGIGIHEPTEDKSTHENKKDWYFLVPFTLPNEIVMVELVENSWGYTIGKLVEIVEKSSESESRIAPQDIVCKYFGQCSGCQLQMLDYQHQLEFKWNVVANEEFAEILNKFPQIKVNKVIGSPNQFEYRTKITPHYNNRDHDIGFNSVYSKYRIVDIEECAIATKNVNMGLKEIRRIKASEDAEEKDVDKNKKKKKSRGGTYLIRDNVVDSTDEQGEQREYILEHNQICNERLEFGNGMVAKFEFKASEFFQNNRTTQWSIWWTHIAELDCLLYVCQNWERRTMMEWT